MKTRHTRALSVDDLLKQYACGAVNFSGDPNASYERHLLFDHVVEPQAANLRERFEAVASALRDLLAQRWVKTQETYDRANPKQVYYLSMEFLIGRSLTNNLTNLLVEPIVPEVLEREGLDLLQLAEQEPDAGLGNGGLGRLAACFLDSLATLQVPAIGYGLRYDYGIFRQEIEHGYQVEHPDYWLRHPDPWEVARPFETVEARANATVHLADGVERLLANCPAVLLGIPFDRPVVGYGGTTINTLRLW
jgi:glycogen phosphorylase